jgi:hypothetical protein
MTEWIKNLTVQRQAFREKVEERQALTIPSEDPDWEDLGQALPLRSLPERDAILQPPKPSIKPAAKILELAREQDATPEAAE